MNAVQTPLEVERTGESSGHCDCCGRESHTIWGYVHEAEGPTLAAYFVRWTDGHVDELGINLDLIVGTWGGGSSSADRAVISLLQRQMDDGRPSLMVIDAKPEPSVADAALPRDEVVGTPLAAQIFRITDAIYEQDARLPSD